jgi:transposase-like protein
MNTWERAVRDWQGSGISQAEYCRKHKLNEGQFSYWKRKLSGNFVEVVKEQPSVIELEYHGAKIRINQSSDLSFLRKVLEALK